MRLRARALRIKTTKTKTKIQDEEGVDGSSDDAGEEEEHIKKREIKRKEDR